MLVTVAQHYGFDLNQPYDQLPESAQRVILHGSGETEIPFTYTNERGRKMVRRHPFEGVIPSLERRLRETDSLVVRDELAKLRSQRACPACEGSRLRREARNVFIGDGEHQRGIWQISAAPLAEATRYFESLDVHGLEEGDRVARSSRRSLARCISWSTSDWTTCRWIAPPTRSRAESRSASASRRRSGPA